MLKTRIITGSLVFLLFMWGLFFMSPTYFAVLILIVMLIAAWEFAALAGIKQIWQKALYAIFIGFLLIDTQRYLSISSITLISFLWWLCAFVLVFTFPKLAAGWSKNIALRCLMGVLVLIPTGIAITFLKANPDGIKYLFLVLLLVAFVDTAAFFVGRQFGNKKLAKDVSPNKSWEGFWGGVIAAMIVAAIAGWILKLNFGLWVGLVITGIVTALFAVVGDLFESMLKRNVNVKDSGTILPGHGGILDRIDAYTAAVPIYVCGLLLTGLLH